MNFHQFVVETVVTLKLPVLIGTGPVRHEVSFQADPSAITPTAPPLDLVPNPPNPPNPNEKPAKSSLDDRGFSFSFKISCITEFSHILGWFFN